ncbi:MAG: stage II sporulation protein D [Clostridia bacterium]|nr:stage II sporulation protein D [Clostridia bacterium]
MNFFKTKIAFFIISLMLTPIFTVKLFPVQDNDVPIDREINVFDTETGSVVTMKLEEYITGVVAAEMPAEFHTEALKAQAVAARTYFVNKRGCSNHAGADICTDSSHCQAYKTVDVLKTQWGSNFKKYYNKISSAVYDTSGEIILYDGEPISAVFHSTSSGRTENAADVWGNSRPYLTSVESAEDAKSPKFASAHTVSLDEFKSEIMSESSDVNFEDGLISDIKTTAGGAVDVMKIGGVDFKGTKIREIFGLNSANFTVDIIGSDVIFDVRGYGHGVGMSQYGAFFMAENGSDYKEIIKKYYSGVDISSIDNIEK